MPESKKISELPAFSTVQSGDILPVVDSTLTQTGKCTAGQIAAIGGGPPGTDTVSNQHVLDAGLQARKLGFTASDRIAYSTTNTDTIEGATRYRCSETTLTQYARDLLSKADAASAWTHLAANPNYSGPISVPPGTPTNPTYTFRGANNTGIFLSDDSVCISANGQLLYMFSNNRDMYSLQAGSPEGQLSPAIPFRGYCIFTPGTGSSTVVLDTAREVGEFLGFSNYRDSNGNVNGPNILNTATVGANGLTNGCLAKGVTYISHQSADKDGRSNYSSPQDNSLIILASDGTSTGNATVPYNVQTPATGYTWVGKMTYQTSSTNPVLTVVRNVSSITVSANIFTINFVVPMPSVNYGVVGTVKRAGTVGAIRVTARTTTSCSVTYDSPASSDEVFIGIVR